MIETNVAFLNKIEMAYEKRKNEIFTSADKAFEIKNGVTYYVSADGKDENSGLSPNEAWQTLDRVSNAYLYKGDIVRFRRGDVFRGCVKTKEGVTYAAYGEGDKPKLYGSECSLADELLWEIYDEKAHIWRTKEMYLDSGTLVFNEGQFVSRKLIPSYKNLQFVCRDDETRIFDVKNEMTQNLDMYWEYDTVLTKKPSRNEDFPIPFLDENSKGYIYLRCDEGNPGKVFAEIESCARTHMIIVAENNNVHVDNLCIKYVGMHGVAAGGYNNTGLTVTNCEFGYIGGTIQHYFGTDPNFVKGGRGTVTRFGNAVEIYGGCDNYTVIGNYIYEVYDAGITHQVTIDRKLTMTNIRYEDNLIEKCVYGIEYFLNQIDGEHESYMDNVSINNNIIRLSGYGWGQQRHNTDTPAAIKGWSYTNTARNFTINDNIFDRCAYRLLHLVALKDEYCATMNGNTYIQSNGGMLGQYGGNEISEPEILIFDENIDKTILEVFGDKNASVYFA